MVFGIWPFAEVRSMTGGSFRSFIAPGLNFSHLDDAEIVQIYLHGLDHTASQLQEDNFLVVNSNWPTPNRIRHSNVGSNFPQVDRKF